VIPIEEYDDPNLLTHSFSGLLGGLDFAVTVRCRNGEGQSGWAEPLATVRTPAAVPFQCPPPQVLEAKPTAFLIEFSLPFNNGDTINAVELEWIRVTGPMDRHLAIGGRRAPGTERLPGSRGVVISHLPLEGGPAPAPPYGIGGSAQAWLTDLEAGTEYDVQVRARNSMGFGASSARVRMVCSAGKPDVPVRMRHSNGTSGARPPPRQQDDRPPAAAALTDVGDRSTTTRDLTALAVAIPSSSAAAAAEQGGDSEEPPEAPVVPTIFMDHTFGFSEPEVVSVAADHRATQRRLVGDGRGGGETRSQQQ